VRFVPLLVLALLLPQPLEARQVIEAPLTVSVDPAGGLRPLLNVGPILADAVFEETTRSGLPVRMNLRVELWRDGFFDRLEGTRTLTAVLYFQPLEESFVVHTRSAESEPRHFPTFQAARTAIEGPYTMELRPNRRGRYYYTAVLELETLSLSDLEELERWLRGELQPAVSGDGSLTGAVGQGVKRFLVRVLGLPARRYEARSEWFRFDLVS